MRPRRQPLVLRDRTCTGQLNEVVEVGEEPHRCVWASVKGELQLDTAAFIVTEVGSLGSTTASGLIMASVGYAAVPEGETTSP